MFVLSWESYPFIMLCVALPMAAFYVVERRRERREEAAYDGPCMAHVGTDRGAELWCWQKSGHSGAHDDSSAYEDMMTLLRDWQPHTDADGELIGFSPPQGVCGNVTVESDHISGSCVRAPGHIGECSDF